MAKRPRSDGQDASRLGPAVTPAVQGYHSAAAVEQLASLQCRLSLKGVAKKPVTDLAGKGASRPPSVTVDGEAVPRGEKAPIQGRARRSDPELPVVREGDLSDRLHQQDDRGADVPSVQGSR